MSDLPLPASPVTAVGARADFVHVRCRAASGCLPYSLPPGAKAFTTTRAFFTGEAQHPERERCVELLEQALGYPVVIAHQQHTDHIRRIDEPLTPSELEGVDALVTNRQCICLCITTADCIPVLLYDPRTLAIAAVHAGWRGTAKRIVEKTISTMQMEYGTDPQDLYAVIGPGISGRYYEVGTEVIEAFREAAFPLDQVAKGRLLDLPLANRLCLLQAGIPDTHIHDCAICTYENYQEYFSYRREGPHTGRNLNGIILY